MKKALIKTLEILITVFLLSIFIFAISRYTHGFDLFSSETYVLNENQNISLTDQRSKALLEDLVKSKKLLSVNEIYSRTLNYYDRLFSILIAILAILATLSILYIQTSSRDKAREDLKDIVNDHLESEKFKERIMREFLESQGNELESKIDELNIRTSRNEEILEVLDTKGRSRTVLKNRSKSKKI